MTSEICLMNRLAVTLAADSATTVSNDQDNTPRFFKGANKIFQLSENNSIAIMIYNAADVLTVPWEIIIKEYRKNLGKHRFAHVHEVRDHFVAFINQNEWLLPQQIRLSGLIGKTKDFFGYALSEIEKQPELLNESIVPNIISFVKDYCSDLDWKDHYLSNGAQLSEQLKNKFTPDIAAYIMGDLLTGTGISLEDARYLAQASIEVNLHTCKTTSPQTGAVFAGFGDNDLFPAISHAELTFIGDQLLVTAFEDNAVDHQTPALIKSFAQQSMIEIFRLGVSTEFFVAVATKVEEATREAIQKTVEAVDAKTLPDNVEDIVSQASEKVRDAIIAQAQHSHAFPMAKVLASLPIHEMAELAETLLHLQSLKEKVTSPTESVGGPIDVAVITRAEGLVWIKRKQYFDPALNSRFFERQAQRLAGRL